MATQKQHESQGDGGRGQQGMAQQGMGQQGMGQQGMGQQKMGQQGTTQQGMTVHRGQDRQLSRDRTSTSPRMARTRPFSMMRRMLDNLDEMGTFGMTSPFSTMRRMFDDMERMLDTDVFGDLDVSTRALGWAPRIEISQREDKLVVRADVPGVPQDQIQISTEGDALVIEGERVLAREQQEDVWCSECAHGWFRRVITLPQGADPEKAQARYENGVLEVTIPVPATQTRARRIEIQGGAGQQGQTSSQLPEGTAMQQQGGTAMQSQGAQGGQGGTSTQPQAQKH